MRTMMDHFVLRVLCNVYPVLYGMVSHPLSHPASHIPYVSNIPSLPNLYSVSSRPVALHIIYHISYSIASTPDPYIVIITQHMAMISIGPFPSFPFFLVSVVIEISFQHNEKLLLIKKTFILLFVCYRCCLCIPSQPIISPTTYTGFYSDVDSSPVVVSFNKGRIPLM